MHILHLTIYIFLVYGILKLKIQYNKIAFNSSWILLQRGRPDAVYFSTENVVNAEDSSNRIDGTRFLSF